ncbi:hypothetical protein J4G37_36770, partial [Microvirga sp. 3-52]|nr:hypothetical protein [Microvirga sp. 3-52]
MKNFAAWIDDVFVLTVEAPNIDAIMKKAKPPVIYWAAMDQYFPVELSHSIDATTVRMTVVDVLPLGENLILKWGKTRFPVYPRAIVRTDWFEQRYSCLDTELGAIYEETATIFSVWAPTATCVKLCLDQQIYALKRGLSGIWSSKISGNWHGTPYQYEVTVNGQTIHVNDPYSKALLVNSEKSVVVDLSKTNPTNFTKNIRPKQQHLQDAIIYELHVRDATIQKAGGIDHRGKYLGLTETN